MTIIAGFRTLDGIVICGDTQETVPNLSKKHVTKVKVEPWSIDLVGGTFKVAGLGNVAACFCGAGDGAFTDLLTTKVWNSARHCLLLDEACIQIEDTIKATYREYGKVFQPGLCPSVELIYGVKVKEESRMFSARGPVVNEIETYCAGGIGYYMADFLASRMNPEGLTLHQCVILAAYILFQAKEHVDGCGGESHIAVLRHKGKSGLVDRGRIETITKLLNHVDGQLGSVLLAAADLREGEDIDKPMETALNAIRYYREDANKEIKDRDESWFNFLLPSGPKDELGFTLPSTPESSEDPK